MTVPYYESENVKLYNADCLSVMPQFEAQSFDAVITDPPYGIGEKWDKEVIGKNGKSNLWGKGANYWDKKTADNDYVVGLSKYPSIIWGGNFYPLPPVRGWLIWDKIQKFSGADFEMAWTNLDIPPRAYRLSRIDAYVNNATCKKEHPTQKPLELILWCLSFLPKDITILDPFCGSGTTLVAAIQTGRKAVGIEISKDYCDIAVKRIKDAEQQMRLF